MPLRVLVKSGGGPSLYWRRKVTWEAVDQLIGRWRAQENSLLSSVHVLVSCLRLQFVRLTEYPPINHEVMVSSVPDLKSCVVFVEIGPVSNVVVYF